MFHISEKESGFIYFKDLELHTIELKKFSEDANEKFTDLITKIRSSLDMWTAFLTRHDLMNRDALPPALDVLSVINFGDEEREAYDAHLKWLRAEASALKKAEVKAKAEGRAEGLLEGMAEGIAKSQLETAQKLIIKGMPLEEVCKITELKSQVVQELANGLAKTTSQMRFPHYEIS